VTLREGSSVNLISDKLVAAGCWYRMSWFFEVSLDLRCVWA